MHSRSTRFKAAWVARSQGSNHTIHGLWIGTRLSRLELLTLHSFTRAGHLFKLWTYDKLDTPVPEGVQLCDATTILPRTRIFRKAENDAEAGLGKGSYGPFSDLFRYKLLFEHGGIWVDMDVTCLKRFDFEEEYFFRGHRIGMIGNIIKVPPQSELMRAAFDDTDRIVSEDVDWLLPNRILSSHVLGLGLQRYIRSDVSNADQWIGGVAPFVEGNAEIPDSWYFIHWMNEAWKTLKERQGQIGNRRVVDYAPDKDAPFAGSTLNELYRWYGLVDPREQRAQPTPERKRAQTDFLPSSSRPVSYNVLVPHLWHTEFRAVADAVRALAPQPYKTQNVFVLKRSERDHLLPVNDGTKVTFLSDISQGSWHRHVAFEVQRSNCPALFTYQIPAEDLRCLQGLGIVAIPVIDDEQSNWTEPPAAYNALNVPFVVTACEAVGEDLRKAGCLRPIIPVRHELQQRFTPQALERGRRLIRTRYGIDDDVVVVGMIGSFRPQRGYTRAIRVLAALRRFCKAKLLILGTWERDADRQGRSAYEAAMRLAVDSGIVSDIVVSSGDDDRAPYWGAFDVFLNTSVNEAVSLALLEAELAGCPVVAAGAGGNREVVSGGGVLVENPANIDDYVSAIVASMGRRQRVLPSPRNDPGLVPRLWTLLARFGWDAVKRPNPSGTLFVTSSLHIGGPARSLVNLLSRLPSTDKNLVCVLDGMSVERYLRALDTAQIPILRTETLSGVVDRAEQILLWIEAFNVQNVCFWNAPPELKLLLVKVLIVRDIKLVDVSPGPMLFDEMAQARDFQRRISLTERQYIERLDTFVSLYRRGVPSVAISHKARTARVIPLGVPSPPRFIPLPPPSAMLPEHVDERYAIGTCCRVVPDKKIEFLFDMMGELVRRLPKASLTIVGGPDEMEMQYWDALLQRARDERLTYIRFAGRHEDVTPFLATFKVFVMVSARQGCPNASLEAMMMRLPVVANPSGGTVEQVKEGLNGFLTDDPCTMAAQVERLLRDSRLRKKMGAAGFELARERFSMTKMVASYRSLLSKRTS